METTLPRPRQAVVDRLFESNPFYLMSAACMLFGCLALTNSLSWSPIRHERLLILILTLNLYELLLLGLGLFLLAARGIRRDGLTLLILEAFFMIDVSFLNAEIFATDFRIGLVVNIGVLLLAMGKLFLIFRALRLPLMHPALPLICGQLLVLFAFAGMYKHVSAGQEGKVPPLLMYGSWWIIGVMMPLGVAVAARLHAGCFDTCRPLLKVLLILPIVSMIAHVGTSHWVYKVAFTPAHLTPLLLGLACAVGAGSVHVRTLAARMRTQLLLPLGAALLSIKFPNELVVGSGNFAMTPLRFAMAGVLMVYLHGWWLHRHVLFAIAFILCISGGAMMAIRELLWDNVMRGLRAVFAFLDRKSPRTTSDWGVVAVIASFVLLILGAMVSLRRPRNVEPVESLPNDPAQA